MGSSEGKIPFDAGFPIGARSIPVGTRFSVGKSSVLYLCFRLTRKRGWWCTLRCGRVWRQTLFRGSRTGGFCGGGLRHKRRIFEKQNPTVRKRKQRYIKPRPAAAPPLFQCFFRFPLPWVMVVFPRWLMGVFRCLDSFSTSIKLTNCSIVMAS